MQTLFRYNWLVREEWYRWCEDVPEEELLRSRTGGVVIDAWGEIMRHDIAHHIHHAGQLSVWAREVGKKPVSANVIGKGLMDKAVNG